MTLAYQGSTRILLICPTLDGAVGGQAVQAARLVDRLRSVPGLTVEVQSISPNPIRSLDQVKYLRTALNESKYLYDIARRIRHHDIIHVFSAANLSYLLAVTPAVLIAHKLGKKTILNYRSGELSEHFAKWPRTLSRTLGLFDRIVTPSEYLADVFAQHGYRAQSIYNFVDLERFSFRVRDPLRPVFFSNRMFEELYNIPCILRAFGLIQQKIRESRLVIAGDGSQRSKIVEMTKELGLDHVEFVGRVSQDEMINLYDRTDIYLNSPNIDNMPGSIIECYASGVPVVTTNAGGIPYIVEHEKSGLMVEVDDHKALASAALQLLNDNVLAQRLIGQARERVKMYAWEAAGPEWLNLYRELGEKH